MIKTLLWFFCGLCLCYSRMMSLKSSLEVFLGKGGWKGWMWWSLELVLRKLTKS